MTFTKRSLSSAEMGYAVSQQFLLGEKRPVVASESRGPAMVFLGDEFTPAILAKEPGGTMGFAPVPNRDDALFVITEFYPIFKAENSGISFYQAVKGFEEPWRGERVVDLPFVHRIDTVSSASGDYLIAAAVCGGKDFQDDWSRPGWVDAYPVNENGLTGGAPIRLLEDLHTNHGLATGVLDGLECLLISGTEGLFAIALPGQTDSDGRDVEPWRVTHMLEHEVSEIGLIDLDGDGEDELVVVEPFHGNRLTAYKRSDATWNRIYESELAFGHGLSVGMLAGEPVAVVGNRAGSKDLVCYTVSSTNPFSMERLVVDAGAATAGTTIVQTSAGDGIVASNPAFEEYALYIAE